MTSPAAAVAAAYHGVRAAMPLDVLPGRNPIVMWYCCKQPMINLRPFLPPLPAAEERGYYAARLCPTKPPPWEVARGWRPCDFSRNVQITPYVLPPSPIF